MKWPRSVEWKNHISFGIWTLPKKVISIFYKCSFGSSQEKKKQGEKRKWEYFWWRKQAIIFVTQPSLVDGIGVQCYTVGNFNSIWEENFKSLTKGIWHKIETIYRFIASVQFHWPKNQPLWIVHKKGWCYFILLQKWKMEGVEITDNVTIFLRIS